MGYGVADQLRLITKEPNREILWNQQAVYEAVKALMMETTLNWFSVSTIQENIILLPSHELYEMLPLEVLRGLPGGLQLVIQQNGHKFRADR
jgi:hypothetical protein